MKIRMIAPVTSTSLCNDAIPAIVACARKDVEISVVNLDRGPASIESIYEEALAAPQVIQRVLEAERDGVDAVVIDCMNDPGLEAAREMVSIPVVGAAQSAMMLAAILCDKFSVISTAKRDVYPVENLIRRYGLPEKYASTRSVDIPYWNYMRIQRGFYLYWSRNPSKPFSRMAQRASFLAAQGCEM